MNYTRGNWMFIEHESHYDLRATDAEGVNGLDLDLAHIFKRCNSKGKCLNHTLLLASKDMYEALEHIIEYWNGGAGSAAVDAIEHAIETARQALAKAEGGEG